MDARTFEMFVGLLSTLTSRQMSKVVTILDHQSAQAKTSAVLEKAAAANLKCPRCRSKKFYGHVKPMDFTDTAAGSARKHSIR